MEIKKGIAVSPGIAIARAMVIDSKDYRIPRRSIMPSQRAQEIKRVRQAFAEAIRELDRIQSAKRIGESSIRDLFAVHMRFLRDKRFLKRITDYIDKELVTAEYAVSKILGEIAAHFEKVDDAYISERAADIYDIERRLLTHLLGKVTEEVKHLQEEVVIVAHDLSPTQTASFNKTFVKGFATERGGRTSHTAIIARSLGIPAVVALEGLMSCVTAQSMVIVDGNRGVVIIDPDEPTLEEYRTYARQFIEFEQELDQFRDVPAVTRDGVPITLLGNVEFPDEAEVVLQKGGQGIGLYRTEFLYLYGGSEPTEEDHYEAYSEVVRVMGGRPVVIRTMDLGADKLPHPTRHPHEPNPVLGLRSIRYCLQNLPLFKTQLRAILRASTLGDVRLMFPLITTMQELRQAKMILRDVMEDLDEYAVPYNAQIPVGIMIETPSSALMAVLLAMESDFFSIGTNDLTQYTLAVDRANEFVSTMFSPAEPAVLHLIRNVVHDAAKAGIGLSVCGEMASDPEFVMLLLGMGIRELSMAPPLIPEIKKIVCSVTIEECNLLARKVATMDSQRQIKNLLRDAASRILPVEY
ncbi:MAG TPA: phosphoenolpyruvate--protein phosphotransferase [Anaerohalosphaeraceae bacterium]|jgi:phosphotransferase system enzyme I (PtsI)|nr:phosphoenolpyruvate--protein phosphotransferase [Anaerohalosphaeraceae bacterium]HPB92345.1 phosphoenolpyruvate--protein phosphotransferase [Anaerohalosphaeraceae bacterium]HRT22958.1 phosphoenolpyruvate--protein phosphotransferase [Anaerohalosphaeraceae bacterium]HRU14646.1 phosphoenolpyruvate--protein phosphotransferase [Anaerohalosphaeraceae bacterium]